MEILAFDTETHLMGPCEVIPKIVCCSMAFDDAEGVQGDLAAVADFNGTKLDNMVSQMFNGDTDAFIKVAHYAAFDLSVAYRFKPELISGIFREIEEGRVHCTIIREKLLHLTAHGDLEFIKRGSMKKRLEYGLPALVQYYLSLDITADKTDSDAWRKNYAVLEHMPSAEWPQEAQDYAIDDSKHLIPIWQRQEERRQKLIEERGVDPFTTLPFRVGVDFCLQLMTAWGISVDPVRKAEIEAELAVKLRPENMTLLFESGILRAGKPSEPYKNGAKDADGNVKMKKAVAESLDKKKLTAYVENFAANTPDIVLKRTKPSDKFPEGQTSVNAEFMDEYWNLDPMFEQYRNRQKLQKMVTTEIPRMNWNGVTSPIVHPNYDVLKETGRVSSYAGKLYPSFNCQNVDPRARGCYVSREGTMFLSVDYSQMELGTTAQKCYELFGASVMRDKINAGVDLHAYLGSQLAYNLEPAFAESCQKEGADTPEKIYDCFIKCEGDDHEAVRAFFKKYRTFAKPTGLGFPGGLGAATFMQYAKATYGIIVDKEMATSLRNIWRQTFPEMVQYHKWVNDSCEDPYNVEQTDKGERKLYAYSTPMGMYRSGCTYCAVANGAALQSPSAEGALLGLFNIVRACYDPAMNSVLFGSFRPMLFIHDEILGELPDGDPQHTSACVLEIERLMIESMRTITPDVEPRCEAVLMRRWDKFAEPTLDAEGNLVVTEEKGDGHAPQAEAETEAKAEAAIADIAL